MSKSFTIRYGDIEMDCNISNKSVFDLEYYEFLEGDSDLYEWIEEVSNFGECVKFFEACKIVKDG
ncbi:hypothetical protein [uncultured Arcobacter sp.]|uniref:hypothetical protein n=1 Tax=uncultured Arcobacter sp. TaxID=165434 RepID=UPI00261C7D2C|nr:hypothetical protein [uncultured Arcobacter sp.]